MSIYMADGTPANCGNCLFREDREQDRDTVFCRLDPRQWVMVQMEQEEVQEAPTVAGGTVRVIARGSWALPVMGVEEHCSGHPRIADGTARHLTPGPHPPGP